jgi:hypothetical protein
MALVGRTLQEHHKYVDSIKVKFSLKTTSYPAIHKLKSKSKDMYVGLEYSHFTSTNKRAAIKLI